jgi:hypothetical protein
MLRPYEVYFMHMIIETLRAELAQLAEPLPAYALPSFDALATGEFAQIAAALPTLINDLLPVRDPQLLGLGRAGLLAWWYGHLYDNLLDGEGTPATPVLTQLALTNALEAYHSLGLANTPAWPLLLKSMERSAAAHARELQSRFARLDQLTPAQLALWDHALLSERAAPFLFAVQAQAQLAGQPLAGPLVNAVIAALEQLVIARQIGDDAGDWIDDLKLGRLNYVAVRMIGHFQRERPGVPLDSDRLAGYQASAEGLWQALAAEHEAACAAALASLARCSPTSLASLITAQQARGAKVFSALAQSRVAIRGLLGVK